MQGHPYDPLTPSRKSLISTGIDYEREGFQTGVLRVPFSHDRSAYGHIPVPVAVLKQGEGPTVLLTGGNHGDEYEGPVALMKLLLRMPSMRIRGRLIVIPALNFPAFLNGSRTSPIDRGNLNRMFPGDRNGSITAMIAHYVDTELFPRADVVLDLHAGGASFNHMPTLLAALPGDPSRHAEYMKLVHAFAAPHTMVMDLLGEDRTYGAAAERHGTLFLCGEFGGYGSCNVEGLAIVEEGLRRVLHVAGLTHDDTPPPPRHNTRVIAVNGAQHYLFAPRHGVFEPCFALGQEVTTGQLAGRLFDPYAPWEPPRELHFNGSGMVVCARTFASVEPGDCIALLASPARLA
ncbi:MULTISPECIES: succinylglutamate desuccinylase/aspartoacylase family protein [Cupriavidus]|uniref:succinylglutamate desuccinylase/aspartoacylase family protein n=1 Tax=Cupriavidus sp. SK-3 TaxID=1470558 RepID=UPI0004463FAB|nr:succinylglutamate desuccinylase/aspartoacylase family protein [Cupriavidus sp. SK-3]KDP87829.1 succinylglutamate desuccinylase [Cupriavidus sp. SK-3]